MDANTKEAPLRDAVAGLVPDGDGWFIVNVAEAEGMTTEAFGDGCRFESPDHRFRDLGFNVRVLGPGQPNALYHREDVEEAFLVLRGSCVAIVEDQERPMRTGDFLHTPRDTAHVIVGAGDGPCVLVMAGARRGRGEVFYPVSEVAARFGASVAEETGDGGIAYAGQSPPEPKRLGLPW